MGSSEASATLGDQANVQVDATAVGPRPTKKNQGKVPKRVHKAEREKMKREHLNELFLELANALELSQQNSGKASVLCEATRLLKDLFGQIDSLKKEHASLLSESHYVTLEKNELREENSALESQIEKLQSEIEARVTHSKVDLNVPPPEFPQPEMTSQFPRDGYGLPAVDAALQQASAVLVLPVHPSLQAYSTTDSAQLTSKPAPNVSKPHARYPTSTDSWSSQLLGGGICSSGNEAPNNL